MEPFAALDDGLLVRRFMDEFKFRKLLTTQSLYLAPASAFEDEFEGHYSSRDHAVWDSQLAGWGFGPEGRHRASQAKAAMARHNQGAVVISCWTTAPADEPRMWDEYGKSTQSVMVETTVGRLRRSLGTGYLIVPVRYFDFEREAIPKAHALQPFCYKRKHFDWEREVRVIGAMKMGKKIGTAKRAPVSMKTLLTKIGIHSEAPQEFIDSVHQLVQRKLPGTNCELIRKRSCF
mgnify:FL=1